MHLIIISYGLIKNSIINNQNDNVTNLQKKLQLQQQRREKNYREMNNLTHTY